MQRARSQDLGKQRARTDLVALFGPGAGAISKAAKHQHLVFMSLGSRRGGRHELPIRDQELEPTPATLPIWKGTVCQLFGHTSAAATKMRDANSEHELEESTADVDRFVDGGAVVRMKIGGGDEGGSDVDGGGNREGTAAAQEGGAGVDGAVGAVSRFHEDHLRGVLEQVKNWQKVVSEVKLTDSARAGCRCHRRRCRRHGGWWWTRTGAPDRNHRDARNAFPPPRRGLLPCLPLGSLHVIFRQTLSLLERQAVDLGPRQGVRDGGSSAPFPHRHQLMYQQMRVPKGERGNGRDAHRAGAGADDGGCALSSGRQRILSVDGLAAGLGGERQGAEPLVLLRSGQGQQTGQHNVSNPRRSGVHQLRPAGGHIARETEATISQGSGLTFPVGGNPLAASFLMAGLPRKRARVIVDRPTNHYCVDPRRLLFNGFV